ncbi:GTPase [Streptomyces sp. NPDC051051]|uniref:GTPase n=1 Tax=Streptomyces sp. NPDC051051 TaxID=3155666 RepID=UPI00341CDB3C
MNAGGTFLLQNRDLVTRLEKVRDFVAAEQSYEVFLSVRPEWWRRLGPDARFGFRSDRRDALLWAIEARDTGAASGSALEMLADNSARAVIEHGIATALVSTAVSLAPPATTSAARLVAGLPAVASRTDISELRALESWYTENVELFDRVAAAMDVRPTEPDLRAALESLVGELALPSGAVDASRSAYRDIQSTLRAEVEARLQRTSYSAHAIENEDLVGAISRIGALERELRDAVQAMPVVRGRLLVAVAGRTKSGKTTLRKALTRDADRTGIGRGAHRTTRKTSAFEIGSVTYLDTPGVAAKDDDLDAQRARAACDTADAVIWNYADTLRDEESAELQRLLLSGKPLLAVVNVKERVDTPDRLQLFAQRPERAFASACMTDWLFEVTGWRGNRLSFEEEWARLKADALARQRTGMQIDQLPADGGGGAVAPAAGSLVAKAESINGNANLLIEIAGFLHEGRPDAELTTMAREPRTPEDVAKQVARFAGFADDQYLDAVALFAALSTRLRTTGSGFVKIEDDTAQHFLDTVLEYGQYVAPEAR